MSALVVTEGHINYLVNAAIQFEAWVYTDGEWGYATPSNAREIGQVLWNENVRSVNARYSGSGDFEKFHFRIDLIPVKHINVLKAALVLEYNSCETNDWDKTTAHKYIQAIKDATIRCFPGYDDIRLGFY